MLRLDKSLNIGTLVTLGTIIIGAAVAWGVNTNSVDAIKAEIFANSQKDSIQDTRIQTLELNNVKSSADLKYIIETLQDMKLDSKETRNELKALNSKIDGK